MGRARTSATCIGYRTLYGRADEIGSPRAEVAHTIAYRRRKGTASMLEQLARDVTGWDARAVEYFQLLATTQYMNHLRPANAAWFGDPRQPTAGRRSARAFDAAAHTADVRRIARGRGRYNIPNVGIFLLADPRLSAARGLARGQARARRPADRRYLFSPLGADAPLFNRAEAEDVDHAPRRARQRARSRSPGASCGTTRPAFYPASASSSARRRRRCRSTVVAAATCPMSTGGWAYAAGDTVLIDPVLGRLALPATLTVDGPAGRR